MKEIVIISGKGGTGKTSLTAAFASLASKNSKVVFADCDVDAADLHLIFDPDKKFSNQFISGHEAVINSDQCISCGKCQKLCQFEAIECAAGTGYFIDPSSCEGCGVCVHFCPVKAIDFPDRLCGEWHISSSRFGTLIHAELYAQAENSGKLVSTVRKEARRIAAEEKAEYVIIDGPPGIGCPVIASITGTQAIVAITEPSLSGKHDLERVAKLARHFMIPLFVCVNKWDINPIITSSIIKMCGKYKAQFIGKISYDKNITSAQIQGLSLIEYTKSTSTGEIEKIWKTLNKKLQSKTKKSFLKNVWGKLQTR